MNKQDAPARIEAKTERPAHPSRPFLKNRCAVDRVRAPASLKVRLAAACQKTLVGRTYPYRVRPDNVRQRLLRD